MEISTEIRESTPSERLDKPSDWTGWYLSIQTLAETLSVWQYIDPQTNHKFVPITSLSYDEYAASLSGPEAIGQDEEDPEDTITAQLENQRVTRSHTQQAATSQPVQASAPLVSQRQQDIQRQLARLEGADRATLNIFVNQGERHKNNLVRVFLHIKSSIHESYKVCISDQKTSRGALRALMGLVRPTAYLERRDNDKEFEHAVSQPQRKTTITEWIRRIQGAKFRCNRVNSRYADNSVALDAFFEALRKRDDAQYPYYLRERIKTQSRIDGDLIFNEVIEEYRQISESMGDIPSGQKGAAFHTSLGINESKGKSADTTQQPQQPAQPNSGSTDKRGAKCDYCLLHHVKDEKIPHWKNCFYCVPELRQKLRFKIKINKDTEAAVQQKILANRQLQQSINDFRTNLQGKIRLKETPINTANPEPERAAWMTQVEGTVFHQDQSEGVDLTDEALYDTGSDVHIFNSLKWFTDITWGQGKSFKAGMKVYKSHGQGTVEFTAANGTEITISEAQYHPEFPTNLVSASILDDKGMGWNSATNTISRISTGRPVCYTERIKGHIRIPYTRRGGPDTEGLIAHAKVIQRPVPLTKTDASMWHNRMGHPGPHTLQQLESYTRGVKLQGIPQHECEICATCKIKQKIVRQPVEQIWPQGPGQVLSFDIFSPGNTADDGSKTFANFTCRYSGMKFPYALKTKDESFDAFLSIKAMLSTRYNIQVKVLISDLERGLITRALRAYIDDEGIELRTSSPAHSFQNGHAERSGGTLMTVMRCLMQQSQFPAGKWVQAAEAAAFLVNRTPRERQQWKTPYETFFSWLRDNRTEWKHLPADCRPRIDFIRAFGCRAYAMRTEQLVTNKPPKLEQRAHIGYLAGYVSSTQYLVWVPVLRQNSIISSSHVIFDEERFYGQQLGLEEQPTRQQAAKKLQEIEATDEVISFVVPEFLAEQDQGRTKGNASKAAQGAPDQQQENDPIDQFNQNQHIQITKENNNADTGAAGITPPMSPERQIQQPGLVNLIQEEIRENLALFNTVFSEATQRNGHISVMPPLPRSWKEMLGHSYSREFIAAAHKQVEELKASNTFTEVTETEARQQARPLSS